MRPLSLLGGKVIVQKKLLSAVCMVPCNTRQMSAEAQRKPCSSCDSNDTKSREHHGPGGSEFDVSLITEGLYL